VQTVAGIMIAIAGAVVLAVLAASIRDAVDGRSAGFAVKLQTTLGLALLGLAASFATSARTAIRTSVLAVVACVTVAGLAALIASMAGIGVSVLPANTALLFACLGIGMMADRHRAAHLRWLADGLVLASGAVALLALIAVLFSSDVQYPITNRDPMTVVTSVVGLVLSTAVLLRRTDYGLGKLFNSNTSGGVLARRLVPLLLILVIGIARLTYLGVEAGAYDAAFATSIGLLIGAAALIAVIDASASAVDRLETVRRGNEAQIRQMVGDIARQSKELQRTNQELESFSYSVSHDLRAPIRHIAGFSELVARSGDKLDDKTRRYIAMIAESAEQAGKLIDDLLEFSRMGRAELQKREVGLDEIVRDAWMKLAPERAGRNIELRAADLPTVCADPAMVEMAISNLLSNAVKYTARRTAAVIDIEARSEGDEVIVSIRDNGVGFDMTYVDKLFGVFQRLHGDDFEGVGIGLANVKRIVERHGGRVWAEGEVDRGACFYLSLPRANAERRA
jgi:signal transduction histidine kinase